ncbi:MAG: TonB family protein [Thermoanaerobaculia bacterium]
MSPKNRPYEQFGSFLLFKRLENDGLGELWRAGRIEGSALGSTVALRRFLNGSRDALQRSAQAAQPLAPLLTGTTFAKDQEIDLIDGVPCIVHEYAGGRSLRHIVDRSRGGTNSSANPIPLDQAIVIAEKIALSLSTTADLRYLGKNLAHGALIPQFVWISDDGEIRVAGQQLGAGLLASLSDPKIHSEISRYLAPEYQTSGDVTRTTDVYSLGAILYLLLTGNEPPEATGGSAFTQTVRASRTTTGQPMPEDLRSILDKSLAIDPSQRFASIGDMKQAVSAITHGGKYSATTFNLAFYLSTLLKKELEGEAIDRERESKVNLLPYLAPATPEETVPTPLPIEERPMFGSVETPKSNRTAMMAMVAAVVLLAGAGGFFFLRGRAKPEAPVAVATPTPTPAPAPVIPPPMVVAAVPADGSTTTGSVDPKADKKAFELAVQQKLQEEMLKLQSDYNQQLKQSQSKNAPVQVAGAVAPPKRRESEESASMPSAATLDQRRVSNIRQETATTGAPEPSSQSSAGSPPTAASPEPVPTSVAAAVTAAPTTHEGDVIDMGQLDSTPQPLSPIRADYPRLAMQQRARTTVIVSALISETGSVMDVKILRGDPRFGFNDAAIRAMKAARFTAPMKDGKHVRTWRPQTFAFSL